MKRDLLVGGLFIVLAALGLGGVLLFTIFTQEGSGTETILPKTEPIAEFKKKDAEVAKPPPVRIMVIEKKAERKKVDEGPKVLPKKELEPPPAPKVEPKKVEIGPELSAEKNQSVPFHYRRAGAAEAAPRIDRGEVDARADQRELAAERK